MEQEEDYQQSNALEVSQRIGNEEKNWGKSSLHSSFICGLFIKIIMLFTHGTGTEHVYPVFGEFLLWTEY
jgi:hypothetical protein